MIAARIGAAPPEARDHVEEPCAICAGPSFRGIPIEYATSSSTTDHALFRDPSHAWVCDGCFFVRARISPVPGRDPKEGKTLGGCWRNYSHFVDANRYENASKGEKPKILGWLRSPKRGAWACAIADSGQKHVLSYAPTNPAGTKRGRVRFEEQTVTLPTADGWAIVDACAALLTAGATKEEIARGDYTARAWTLCRPLVEAFEREHGGHRGSAWFALVLWLSQRDEQQVAMRLDAEKTTKKEKEAKRGKTNGRPARKAANKDRGGAPRSEEDLSARGHEAGVEALGADPKQGARGGKNVIVDGRVGNATLPGSPAPSAGQLGLFGGAGPDTPRARGRAGARTRSGGA